MKTETKQALRAALETPAFAGVREALRAESKRATSEALVYHDEPAPAEDYWRNDGWQAAWRDMASKGYAGVRVGDSIHECTTHGAGGETPCILIVTPCYGRSYIAHEDLAAALRDIALEELCKK